MNKTLRYIALLAILPLFTTGLGTDYLTDAGAVKSKGTGIAQYGSSTNICGLDLCSNYPGGRTAWESEQGKVPSASPVKETEMEETMMEKTHEDKMSEADLGSVLRT